MMKNAILIGVLAVLLLPVQAQRVQLQVEGIAPAEMGMLFLTDIAKGVNVDSTLVFEGRFRFNVTADSLQFYKVGSRDLSFVLISDGQPVSINFNRGILTGSALNEKMHNYDLRISQLEINMMLAFIAQNEERLNTLRESWREAMKQAVVENPNNVIPAYYIGEVSFYTPREEMLQLLSPDKAYSKHPLCQPVIEQLSHPDTAP
jgi:hypothetical protein